MDDIIASIAVYGGLLVVVSAAMEHLFAALHILPF
jgi:hypothetical protein